ncbi:DUF2255 family protein [Gordonia rhizosphera]|uniref:Pyridoxamine 5'-phosphate oxidase putative domain-containing protein n=1 Tax=Gordonia rhizosphera NBRC 16068 TaxID=1108045 RepID=K6V8J1_9ACTN|nr:DUF2255 family protein [Gordonia rhizosphera]GAB92548.1 hypothetical protein GORHZ_183_00070 [Gordonia rhizosphera NBRC 16068]
MTWNTQQLDRIGGSEELHITSYRRDGSLRKWTPIWVVRVDDDLYIRSAYGADGAWYRHATAGTARVQVGDLESDATLEKVNDEQTNDRVADAYRAKYHNQPGALKPMLDVPSAASTVRLVALSS